MLQRRSRDEANQGEWRVVASNGDLDLRVRQGMQLGESAAGTLSLDPANAQLWLEISDDGDLIIHAADGFELSTPEASHCRRELVPRQQRVEVRLAANLLRFDTSLADQTVPAATIDLHVTAATAQQEASPATDAAQASTPREPATDGRDVSLRQWFMPVQEPRPEDPPKSAEAPEPVPAPETEPQPVSSSQNRRPAPAPRKRFSARLGALVGLAGIAMAAAFLLLGEGDREIDISSAQQAETGVPSPDEPMPRASSSPADRPAAFSETPAVEPLPATLPEAVLLPPPLPPATDQPEEEPPQNATQPENSIAAAREPQPSETAAPAAAATTEVPIEPMTIPAVERRPTPAPPADPQVSAARPQRGGAAMPKPDPAQVAVLERIGRTAIALAGELEQQRNRLAADLALRQGRLVMPPEDNALALYQQMLESNPQSSEAMAGLQSVRQALINRTLALLAADALDEARETLEAAEMAGADPMLVENLRGEVTYRERRAGDAANGTPGGAPR